MPQDVRGVVAVQAWAVCHTDLHYREGGINLMSSWYDCLPERDVPLLSNLWQGRFALDPFVSERIGLGDVEEAFHRMERGEVLRSVVVP